jgi:hypothetical protein
MKRSYSDNQFARRLVLASVLCGGFAAAAAGWQFVPSAQTPRPSGLQQQIDALPRANGTGMHESAEGGVISLRNPGDPRQRVIRIDRPIRLPSCVAIDGGGTKIVYTGPADRAAIELLSARADGYYFGHLSAPTIANLHIVSSGKGIGFDPSVKGNCEYLTIENVTVSAANDAIDLRPPAGACYATKLENVNVYGSGAAALYYHGNTVTIDGMRVCYGTRDGFKQPPAFVNLRGVTGGGGTVRDLHVESFDANRRESVTPVRIEDGSWTLIQGHFEQPGPSPAVVVRGKDTIVSFVNPGWYSGVGILVEEGARVDINSAYPIPESFLQRDARSEISLNGAKRGVVATPRNDAR